MVFEKCGQRLANHIGEVFHRAFTQVLADRSCSDDSEQSYLKSYYTDGNAFRRHEFFRSLKTLVKCALDVDDTQHRVITLCADNHPEKAMLGEALIEREVVGRTWDRALMDAENIVFPGMFKGPSKTVLDSWVSIPSDRALEERLSHALQQQFEERQPDKRWLSRTLDSVNAIFMTSCFGVKQRDDGDYGFFLLPHITIRPPFYLTYSGIVTDDSKHAKWGYVEPYPGVFITPEDEESENFFRFLTLQGPAEFIMADDRPGLVRLVKPLTCSDDILELHRIGSPNICRRLELDCQEPSSSQPIPVKMITSGSLQNIPQRVVVPDYIDYSNPEQSKKIRNDINENGYSCVEFLESFREAARAIFNETTIHELARNALGLANKIRETNGRYYFKYGPLFSDDAKSHQLLRSFINGPLKNACSQLQQCIDSGLAMIQKHSLIWQEGTIGLLSKPHETEQKPHCDCAPQLCDNAQVRCPPPSETTLTVVGMCKKFLCFIDCLLCCIVVFQSIAQMKISPLLFGRRVFSRFN